MFDASKVLWPTTAVPFELMPRASELPDALPMVPRFATVGVWAKAQHGVSAVAPSKAAAKRPAMFAELFPCLCPRLGDPRLVPDRIGSIPFARSTGWSAVPTASPIRIDFRNIPAPQEPPNAPQPALPRIEYRQEQTPTQHTRR